MLTADMTHALQGARSAETVEELREHALNFYIAALLSFHDEKPRQKDDPTKPEILDAASEIYDAYVVNQMPATYELKWLFDLCTGRSSARRDKPKTDPRLRETLAKLDAAKDVSKQDRFSNNLMAKFLLVTRRTVRVWRSEDGYEGRVDEIKDQLIAGEKLPVFNPRTGDERDKIKVR